MWIRVLILVTAFILIPLFCSCFSRIYLYIVCASFVRHATGIARPAVHQRVESRVAQVADYGARWQSQFRAATQAEEGIFEVNIWDGNSQQVVLTYMCARLLYIDIYIIRERKVYPRNPKTFVCLGFIRGNVCNQPIIEWCKSST